MSIFKKSRLRYVCLNLAWKSYRKAGRRHYFASEDIRERYDCGESMLLNVSSEYRIHQDGLNQCIRRIKVIEWLLDRYD